MLDERTTEHEPAGAAAIDTRTNCGGRSGARLARQMVYLRLVFSDKPHRSGDLSVPNLPERDFHER